MLHGWMSGGDTERPHLTTPRPSRPIKAAVIWSVNDDRAGWLDWLSTCSRNSLQLANHSTKYRRFDDDIEINRGLFRVRLGPVSCSLRTVVVLWQLQRWACGTQKWEDVVLLKSDKFWWTWLQLRHQLSHRRVSNLFISFIYYLYDRCLLAWCDVWPDDHLYTIGWSSVEKVEWSVVDFWCRGCCWLTPQCGNLDVSKVVCLSQNFVISRLFCFRPVPVDFHRCFQLQVHCKFVALSSQLCLEHICSDAVSCVVHLWQLRSVYSNVGTLCYVTHLAGII